MHKNQVIKILKTFSTEDWNSFIRFVKSPYFNNRNSVIALTEIIQQNSNDFQGEWLQRNNLFEQIFPNELYNYKRISESMTRLFNVAVKFMSITEVEKEPTLLLVQAGFQSHSRGLNSVAKKLLRKAKKVLENTLYHDAEYYYAVFLATMLERLLDQGDIHHNKELNVAAHRSLDYWNIHWKLDLASSGLAHGKLVKGISDAPLLKELLENLKEHEYLKEPLIGLSYYGFMLTADSNNADEHYENFNSLFIAHSKNLPLHYKLAFHAKASNYCLTKYYSGDDSYIHKAFLLDSHAETEGFLIAKNYLLSESKFKGLVTLALECGEIDYADRFIKKYSPQLPEENRQTTIQISRADVECSRGNFKTARELLSDVRILDDFDQIKIHTLQMKMSFEEKQWEDVKRCNENLLKFIKRKNTIADEFEARVRTLTDFTSRIATTALLFPNDIKICLDEIEMDAQTSVMNYKSWFLRELKNLQMQDLEYFFEIALRKKDVIAVQTS